MAIITNTYTNYVNGTGDSDVITNYIPAYVHGNNGNDQVANAAQIILAKGDNGDDVLVNYAFGSSAYLDGGNGNDYIANVGSGVSTLYGGYGIYDAANDNDTLIGSSAAVDFFVVGEYGGYDVIANAEANDLIYFGIPSGAPPYAYMSGADLVVTHYSSTVVIQNWAYTRTPIAYLPYYNYNNSFDAAADTASDNLWGGANVLTGTAEADNIFISKNDGNDLIFDAARDDTIHFYDATLSDIVGTAVSDNAVAIAFNTGETTVVETKGNTSATFKLASGESYVYNREAGAWQQA